AEISWGLGRQRCRRSVLRWRDGYGDRWFACRPSEPAMRPVRQAAGTARRHHPSCDLRIRTIHRPRRQGRLQCATGGWRLSGWSPSRISALAERLPRSARQDRSGLFFYESATHEYGLPPWYRVGRASLSAYILSTAPNCWQKLAQLKARRETLQVVATQISFVRLCAAGPACLRD